MKEWNPGHPFTIVVAITRRAGELHAKQRNLARGEYRIVTPGLDPGALRGLSADLLLVVGYPQLSTQELDLLEQCFIRSTRGPFRAIPVGDP